MGEEGVDDWSIKGVWGRREWMAGPLEVCEGGGGNDWSIRNVWGKREWMTGPLKVCG